MLKTSSHIKNTLTRERERRSTQFTTMILRIYHYLAKNLHIPNLIQRYKKLIIMKIFTIQFLKITNYVMAINSRL